MAAPDRPVIGFLTDFGFDGAAAICRGVMLSIARDAQIVDISHAVRKFAIADGAYLLRAALPWMPVGVHVAVVDPGVGTARRPIAVKTARGDILVGPDNGLLVPAAERLGGPAAVRELENRAWMLPATSATFHGRDIFAPIGAHLAIGEPFDDVGPELDAASLVRLDLPEPEARQGRLATGVVYVDSFGNLRLAGGVADLQAALGPVEAGTGLIVDYSAARGGFSALAASETGDAAARRGDRWERLTWRRTFGEAAPGDLLAYEDSSGNLAIAVSNGDAASRLGAGTGARIGIRRA
ncbi:MAG TPA: SAM-dependent chlorinase/fluorinase [Candidatus Limnocylindrales bacterium]|nr:SAM-dependent chlorinase/fluorinase [Candidatus Limnocylindrales bacterium]